MNDSNYYGLTRDDESSHRSDDDFAQIEYPPSIGRYRIERVIGHGGFGVVFLARDEQLNRPVAVKVPHAKLISCSADAEAYLNEARTVASLDHPNIVPVHDVGCTAEYPCFIVSKYIDGESLQDRLKDGLPVYPESVELVATIAEALQYAHSQGLVHRDIKPGNILIDSNGGPHLVDFGLALTEENLGRGPRYAGTPGYMSPEQARGEGHRVDGRSDIFSLGVVLYRLLAGRTPFRGNSREELMDQVTTFDPKPLRQYDARIPRELERICHKAMSKKASERYSSAIDLAEDLRHLLADQSWSNGSTVASGANTIRSDPTTRQAASATTSATSAGDVSDEMHPSSIRIVPKGLRSFDEQDSDFMLELLPGPRDRDGLPEIIRFWKSVLEQTDPDRTSAVGLIYGPSGCGKSSLVKAGLIPRLDPNVITVYVEATPDDTESRLLAGLRKHCPLLDGNLDLRQSIAAIRKGSIPFQRKVLIVLDQFEQWLHAKRDEGDTELVRALRQCNGGQVQCLLMVRDDFWMGVTRFLNELEIRLEQGRNFAPVDLFPVRHATNVLIALGRAYGALPESSADLSELQRAFLDQAIEGLTENGKVICVRLALFAEMMKAKPWTPQSLREAGGTRGVGISFLEDTFSVHTNPAHHYHQPAARRVLQALLPDSGGDLKGQMKSYRELLEISGYQNRLRDFEELIRILDHEMRLITPTEPGGVIESGSTPGATWKSQSTSLLKSPLKALDSKDRYFQLTHDYLVSSLRRWLTRKQKESREGRAELLLADRSKLWNARPEIQQLPSYGEFLNIRWLTDRRNWSQAERRMMASAGKYHLVRTGIFSVIVVLLASLAYELNGRARASALVAKYLASDTLDVPERLDELKANWRWAKPALVKNAFVQVDSHTSPEVRKANLHAQLAMIDVDESFAEVLLERIPQSPTAAVGVIGERLSSHAETLCPQAWARLDGLEGVAKLKMACTLAILSPPDDDQWESHRNEIAALMIDEISGNVGRYDQVVEMLHPVGAQLIGPIADLARDPQLTELKSENALNVFLVYARDGQHTELVCDVLCDGSSNWFHRLWPLIETNPRVAIDFFSAEISRSLEDVEEFFDESAAIESRHSRTKMAQRQANAAIALLHLGEIETVLPLFNRPRDPRSRSWFVDRVADHEVPPEIFTTIIEQHSLGQLETHWLFTVLHCLARYDEEDIAPSCRQRMIQPLMDALEQHPDPGVHSSISFLLQRWGLADQLQSAREKLSQSVVTFSPVDAQTDRRWYVNSIGQTMSVIDAETFEMGSEVGIGFMADVDERCFRRIQQHRFAISTREISWQQLADFAEIHAELDVPPDVDVEVAASGISWFMAAEFCNWLSAQEGIPENEWVYRPNEDGEYAPGMRIKNTFLERKGYRLPTEAEWEYACRAGSDSPRYYGFHQNLLVDYAHFKTDHLATGSIRCGQLMPNPFGLFDMYGNAYEWCQDRYAKYPESHTEDDIPRKVEFGIVDERVRVLRGGSFQDRPDILRSTNRNRHPPFVRYGNHGFRIARSHPD